MHQWTRLWWKPAESARGRAASASPVSCACDAWGEQCCKRVCVPPRGERGLPTDPEAVNRRAFSAWCGTVRVNAPTRCAARQRLQRKRASGGRSASNAVIRLVIQCCDQKKVAPIDYGISNTDRFDSAIREGASNVGAYSHLPEHRHVTLVLRCGIGGQQGAPAPRRQKSSSVRPSTVFFAVPGSTRPSPELRLCTV